MIISGEREVPLSPTPKKVGVIAMSNDAVCLDEVIATIMGVDFHYIPTINNARKYHPLPILTEGSGIISSNNNKWNGKTCSELLQDDCFEFELTSGWRDYKLR